MILAMKLLTTVDGLVIKCESFAGGKEKSFIRMPEVTRIEWGYLFVFMLVSYFAGFNPIAASTIIITNFAADWQAHQFGSSILLLFFIVTGASLVHSLFFKTFTRRVASSYRIDRGGFFSVYSSSDLDPISKIMTDTSTATIIDKIELIEDIESCITSTDYERRHQMPPNVRILISYKVIVKFNSGEQTTIESNGLAVWHDEDDQVAFRELIAETKEIVKQIKSFLVASEHEITQSSI